MISDFVNKIYSTPVTTYPIFKKKIWSFNKQLKKFRQFFYKQICVRK